MKNHQFGRITESLADELAELRTIRFLDASQIQETDPKKALANLLSRAFSPITQDAHTLTDRFKRLLATDEVDLATFFERPDLKLTPAVFARLSLQLLAFEPEVDYDLGQPLTAYASLQLPFFDVQTFQHASDVWHAWYHLLTTHTKHGETYLDYLAQLGYFRPFYNATTQPIFFNGKAQPVFDPHSLIREIVYVETPLDSDQDGQRDLLKVQVIRPQVTETGYRAPVLYTASPYHLGTNDQWGQALTHQVDQALTEKPVTPADTTSELKPCSVAPLPPKRIPAGYTQEASEHFAPENGYHLNDYFLSRGFAVVYAAGIGTRGSQGFRDTGSVAETLSTVAVIEWLNGQRQAFTNQCDQLAIDAWWSNRHIAMTGRSYLGTLATAAASTGVDGLKTVIAEAAISSWYDYYRDHGLVAAPDTFQGEDMDVLAAEVFSRRLDAGDYLKVKAAFGKKLNAIAKAQDRANGNYSTYWDKRNYLNQLSAIKADVVVIHGLNDWNVKPRHAYQLWQGLRDLPITKKLILHQGQHIYINNFRSLDVTDMLNLWLTNKLFDLDNGADTQLPAVLVQDNVSPETWHTYPDWPSSNQAKQTLYLGGNQLSPNPEPSQTQVTTYSDHLPDQQFNHYRKQIAAWQHDLLTDELGSPMANNRLLFKGPKLTQDWYLNGVPQVTLTISSDHPFGLVSCQLIDFGPAHRLTTKPTLLAKNQLSGAYDWRKDDLVEFTLNPQVSPYKMITKGHLNLQNQTSLWQANAVNPGQFYTVTLPLQPTVYHLPAGRQLGLVIYATDFATTIRGNQPIHYTVDLTKSRLDLPLN